MTPRAGKRFEPATPAVPSQPTPNRLETRHAPTPRVLRASLVGLAGLIIGVLPLAGSLLLIAALAGPSALSHIRLDLVIPILFGGFLFAGLCGGFAAAWSLRIVGKRGRRAAGQLSVLLAEAIVVSLILIPGGGAEPGVDCDPCGVPSKLAGEMALLGWPVAAIGALIGAHLERRSDVPAPSLQQASPPDFRRRR